MEEINNKPFIFGDAASGDNFTDRAAETARLTANFKNGINTILISPRRVGKTSLVQKVRAQTQSKRLKIVYLDIFSCRGEREFCDMFASAILKQTSSKFDELMEHVRLFLSRINPKISIGPSTISDFSVSLEHTPKEIDIQDILQLPEKIAQKKKCSIVICIDEFQQIGEFKDSMTFQKRLRSVWQLQKNVSYCLFGSKQHLMSELFGKSSRPFYKFGDVMYLQKIGIEDWVKYICERFKATGKSISKELAERICNTVDCHSSYVQQLSWLLWIRTTKTANSKALEEACEDIIAQNSPLFEKQTESLTAYQLNFLRAIIDGVTGEFTSQQVLQKYQLGTSANITIIKRALIKQELIEIENRQASISDPVLRLWLKRIL